MELLLQWRTSREHHHLSPSVGNPSQSWKQSLDKLNVQNVLSSCWWIGVEDSVLCYLVVRAVSAIYTYTCKFIPVQPSVQTHPAWSAGVGSVKVWRGRNYNIVNLLTNYYCDINDVFRLTRWVWSIVQTMLMHCQKASKQHLVIPASNSIHRLGLDGLKMQVKNFLFQFLTTLLPFGYSVIAPLPFWITLLCLFRMWKQIKQVLLFPICGITVPSYFAF